MAQAYEWMASEFEESLLTMDEKGLLDNVVKDAVFAHPTARTTICVVTFNHDFEVYGVAKCRDMKDSDMVLGNTYALKHALKNVSKALIKLQSPAR